MFASAGRVTTRLPAAMQRAIDNTRRFITSLTGPPRPPARRPMPYHTPASYNRCDVGHNLTVLTLPAQEAQWHSIL
jgi:hypothetical protein